MGVVAPRPAATPRQARCPHHPCTETRGRSARRGGNTPSSPTRQCSGTCSPASVSASSPLLPTSPTTRPSTPPRRSTTRDAAADDDDDDDGTGKGRKRTLFLLC